MMRVSYFGVFSIGLFVLNALISMLEPAGVFPYTRTLYFPMLAILGVMVGSVGWYERDKKKLPAISGTVLGVLSFLFWVSLLIYRLSLAQ